MADALRLSVSHGESKPRVAIVGGGYLGSRIAAELGLANCDVMIYDRGAGPNVKQGVERALCELEQYGLLKMDDGSTPPRDHHNCVSEGAKEALSKVSVGLSIAECVSGRNLIIEAVPDEAHIKGAVFSEAIQHCAPDALLTTNTLNVTLQEICDHMPDASWHNRMLGLRFLSPVMFVPMCEITYHPGAQDHAMQRLSHMMEALEKMVFDCPFMDEAVRQGDAAAPAVPAQNGRPPLPPGYQRRDTPYWLGYSRLRLDAAESRRHQQREARLWLLRRTEKLSPMERTRSKQEAEMEMCVVCLTNPREALSISCGHKVMCPDCAAKVKMINSSCPFCRVAMREVVLSKQKSPAQTDGEVETTGGAAGTEPAWTAAVAPAARYVPPNCPGNHGLVGLRAGAGGCTTCKRCHGAVQPGGQLHGCLACRYVICGPCNTPAPPVEALQAEIDLPAQEDAGAAVDPNGVATSGEMGDDDAERIASIALPSGEQLSPAAVAEMMADRQQANAAAAGGGEPEQEVEMGEAPPVAEGDSVEDVRPAAEMAAAAAEARQSASALESEEGSEGSGDL